MRKYHSYSRKKNNKGKWIIVLVFLAFAAFKIYNRSMNPALSFAQTPAYEDQAFQQELDISLPLPIEAPQTYTDETTPSNFQQVQNAPSQPQLETSFDDTPTPVDSNLCSTIHARDSLNQMLSATQDQQQTYLIKKQLSSLSDKWLFSRSVFPNDRLTQRYTVKPGDTAAYIGTKFKVPYQILMTINNISDPRSLRAGETIKVINGPFHCKIDRSAFTMDLYLQDTYIRSFVVGLGKPGMETPTGKWLVKQGGKLISPTWTDPDTGKTYQSNDPDYPLGSRWIALDGIEGSAKGRTGFAIHGTNKPQQLGMAQSRGCIRLFDDHVKLVYDLLTPGLSQVIIED